MKLYYLEDSPKVAASMYSDMDIVKLPVFYLRALSTVVREVFSGYPMLYKPINPKDPIVQWALNGGYHWLIDNVKHMLIIYENAKGKPHESRKVYRELPHLNALPFVTPEAYFPWLSEYSGSIIEKHRAAYKAKCYKPVYTMNDLPYWMKSPSHFLEL